MNKQELAKKVFSAAEEMRGNMNTGEYKDYVLGFLFYKYLSQHEVDYFKSLKLRDEDLPSIIEDDSELVKSAQGGIGYFIGYSNLFSTWMDECQRSDFSIAHVYNGLNAFNRLISPSYRSVYDHILDTLSNGLVKLGSTDGERTNAAAKLLAVVDEIPVDGREDYDVLGFVYEYLLQKFASNAGKKSGEFYTPHEVSVMMSEIIAHHLAGRQNIKVYDPTSGSGSLLLTVGRAFAKQSGDRNSVKYYAQEKEAATWNLTRMNLLMRGISPANIVARNGDSLARDWPLFEETNPEDTYEIMRVDAATSNPPYSKHWTPPEMGADPRFIAGLAPKTKADYAFLLHTLYHVKPDGIMTIVLPHGVLFRGDAEGEIRRYLIEHRNIVAIIGLPSNIFYGTGIPTIVMVLQPKRADDTILFVDASKGFVKDGPKNKLRTSDIQRIVDTVVNREEHPKFSRIVGNKEIIENDYNLNIPRYVDSSTPNETWDIYSTMFGGVPNYEIDRLNDYWKALPGLRGRLFTAVDDKYSRILVDDITPYISDDKAVQKYIIEYADRVHGFKEYVHGELVVNPLGVNVISGEKDITENIYGRVADYPLIDKYDAYQIIDDAWNTISGDLENLQTNGMDYARLVRPHIVSSNKKGEATEVQKGWEGAFMPFDLVQLTLCSDDLIPIDEKNKRLAEITGEINELIGNFDEDELETEAINDKKDNFDVEGLKAMLSEAAKEYATDEMKALEDYLSLTKIAEKKAFIETHQQVVWSDMEHNKSGVYNVSVVKSHLNELVGELEYPEGTLEQKLNEANRLIIEEKSLNKCISKEENELHEKTKIVIENLTNDEVAMLLDAKWVEPIVNGIAALPKKAINELSDKVEYLAHKYEIKYSDVGKDIRGSEEELNNLIGQLGGSEHDMAGLHEFQSILGENS